MMELCVGEVWWCNFLYFKVTDDDVFSSSFHRI